MAIPREFVQQLLAYLQIEEVISSYVVLKKEGHNKKGLCPFHSEKTPSMVVYQDTQSFYCFGCGAGGDLISFIQRIENLDYPEAIHFLAKLAGMEVPDQEQTPEAARQKARILEINRLAARFFHEQLKSPEGKKGVRYLRGRGLSDAIIGKYGLGYAPNQWSSLRDHLHGQGFRNEELAAAQLVRKGNNGSYYDLFRNRVMFPIIDLRGNVIAFGGRVLDDSKPKYLNSPETAVFKKSKNLFSLNFAKSANLDRLILAEGYMDVIAIHAAGFPNVVATLGTSLTAEQARLISTYTKEVLIAYDSDQAGQKATHRAVNLLSEVGVTTRVIVIEGAKDPDEYIKKFGTRRFEMLLEQASNVIEYELKQWKAQWNLQDTNDRLQYLKGVVRILASLQSKLEQELHAGAIAKEMGISRDGLLEQIKAYQKRQYARHEKQEWAKISGRSPQAQDRINPQKARFYKEATAEEHIIAYLFRHPQELSFVLSELDASYFVTDFNRRVLQAQIDLLSESDHLQLSDLAELFSPEEMSSISKMVAKTDAFPIQKQQLQEYLHILKEHKHSLKANNISEMTPEEIEQFRLKKQQTYHSEF